MDIRNNLVPILQFLQLQQNFLLSPSLVTKHISIPMCHNMSSIKPINLRSQSLGIGPPPLRLSYTHKKKDISGNRGDTSPNGFSMAIIPHVMNRSTYVKHQWQERPQQSFQRYPRILLAPFRCHITLKGGIFGKFSSLEMAEYMCLTLQMSFEALFNITF